MVDHSEIIKIANEWATNPYFDENSRQEIKSLITSNDVQELSERFYNDLEFGTGGLRSIMAMGRNRMNKYTVRRATQAVANQLKKTPKELTVAIGYDPRIQSNEFAKETASVLAANGINTVIYDHITPVPLLSYAVRFHKADAGIMITASHNPKQYNGYKLYWDDGAQVTPPWDKSVIKEYNKITDFNSILYTPFEQGLKSGMIKWISPEVEESYFKDILGKSINLDLCKSNGRDLKIIYTPLHGTGLYHCTKILNLMGLTNYHVVKEQEKPDGNFPTAATPNPELPTTLKLAVDLMVKEEADCVMATDPDTDRLGVAVRHKGENHYINGNQMGVLLLHYMLANLKEKNQLPANALVIKTIVTTELQAAIARYFDVTSENTLTGFKWMGARLKEIEDKNIDLKFIFGTEESYGYLTHDFVRDKDAVSAVAMFSEMSLWYKNQGKTVIDGLCDIYQQFGFYHETLISIHYTGMDGAQKITKIMDKFRKSDLSKICDEKIVKIEDYQLESITDLKNNKTTKTTVPVSNVLGFTLSSNNKLYVRPSGTEPKIKFYIMIQEHEGSLAEKKQKAQKRAQLQEKFIRSFCDQA